MKDLTGKRALVTGGSRGIGASIALALADRGADVAISYEQAADRATKVVGMIEARGRRGLAIQANSANPEAIRRLVAEAAEGLGGIDVLINNAGIARMGAIADISLADINAMLDVNVRGTVLTSQAAIPHLGRGGRIVSIGSNAAQRLPFGGLTMYAATKSALLAFTQGLARELGDQEITVNLVQPGPIDTDMNPADGELAETVRGLTALNRYGTPAEVAAAVTFLASPSASYVTGTILTVDAGLNA